jgi:uncharacterized protein YcfL
VLVHLIRKLCFRRSICIESYCCCCSSRQSPLAEHDANLISTSTSTATTDAATTTTTTATTTTTIGNTLLEDKQSNPVGVEDEVDDLLDLLEYN